MKRILAAVSLAVLAAPAFADSGAPFDQNELDRQLPSIAVARQADPYNVYGAPFEQNQFDRGLPAEDDNVRLASAGGGTMSDGSMASDPDSGESPWTKDHNVISPAL